MTRQLRNSPAREPAGSSRESDSHDSLRVPESAAVQGLFRAGLADAGIVRAMQATIGNQAVQRDLHSLAGGAVSAAATAGQRGPSFSPAILGKPPRLNLAIGDSESVSFVIFNAREAPRGTKLTWYQPNTVLKGAGPPIETLATETQDRERKQTLRLLGQAPGTGSYEAKLQVEVPGEAEETYEGPEIEVDVPRPYITDSSWEIRTPDGSARTSPDRLRVGDEYVTRLKMLGVSKTRTDHHAGSAIETSGPKVIQATETTWEQPDVFRMTFRADAIGHGVAKVTVPIGNTPQAQQPVYLVDTHVEMATQDFLNATNQVNTLIDAADRRATAWLASVSNAYALAWKRHTGALKDQADSDRLIGDLILGAALAFVPGGAAGLIGAKMQAAKMGDFMIDGVKELTMYGLRAPGGIGTAAALAPAAGSGLTAYPDDPQLWQNQETIRIKSELAVATERLLDWQKKAGAGDPNFYADFDPVQAMEKSLTVSDSFGKKQKAAELRPVDEGVLADQFEKGFWKTWLEMFGWNVIEKSGFLGWSHHEAADNVGKKIKDRCEELGVPIEKYAEVSRQQRLKEAADLNKKKADAFWGRRDGTS